MNDIGYIQDHDLFKVPDAILLKESRKENQKLKEENKNLNQKITELYNRLQKVQEDIELSNNPLSKEEITALKLDEMYMKQKDENLVLQERLHELRKLVDKSVWKNLK